MHVVRAVIEMPARPRKAAAAAKPDFAKLLAAAKMPESIVPTCLRGDLQAEHEQLNERLELLEKRAVDSLAGNGGTELAAQLDALEDQMRDSTYPIRLRALPRYEFEAFKAKFPPRMDAEGEISNDLDRAYDFNTEAGFEPLVRLSIVDPPDLTDAEFTDLLGKLTESQFESLAVVAWRLNKGEIRVPFSRAASRLNSLTATESKPPTD